ncbi:MAG: hypothetical protein ACKOA7_04090, partial [Bacteroidota bacterium]
MNLMQCSSFLCRQTIRYHSPIKMPDHSNPKLRRTAPQKSTSIQGRVTTEDMVKPTEQASTYS